MGYYTKHEIEIIGGSSDLICELREFSEEAKYALDECGKTEQECKWYSHRKELKEFSLKHPDVLFKLHGEGEENGDVWDEYFKNGKMQVCKARMVMPGFDEKLLA